MFLMTLLKYILYFAIFIVGKSRYIVFICKIVLLEHQTCKCYLQSPEEK